MVNASQHFVARFLTTEGKVRLQQRRVGSPAVWWADRQTRVAGVPAATPPRGFRTAFEPIHCCVSTSRALLLTCRCQLYAVCWVLGISCTLRDFTNLPYHCPITHPLLCLTVVLSRCYPTPHRALQLVLVIALLCLYANTR